MLRLSFSPDPFILEPQNETLLESLVSRIDADNLHTEVDTGKVVGNEEW